MAGILGRANLNHCIALKWVSCSTNVALRKGCKRAAKNIAFETFPIQLEFAGPTEKHLAVADNWDAIHEQSWLLNLRRIPAFVAQQMRVYFSTKNGRKLHVDVDRSSTVETLQCKIVQTLRLNDLQPEDCNQLGRSDLQLSLGGELLEPHRLLSTYALEEGSVVHPRWGSVRAALEVNDAFTWLDPDWHEEIRRRGSRAAGSFLERVCTSPGPTITGLIWPGPLVPQTRAPARRPQAAPRSHW